MGRRGLKIYLKRGGERRGDYLKREGINTLCELSNMLKPKEGSGWFAILIDVKYLPAIINFLGLNDEDPGFRQI